MDKAELQKRREKLQKASTTTIDNGNIIYNEAKRVETVAHNAPAIINNLEDEFDDKVKLTGSDIKFLFFGIALQCVRIYLINKITKIEKAGDSTNKLEKHLHNIQTEIFNKTYPDSRIMGDKAGKKIFDASSDQLNDMKKYYAPLYQIISNPKVPFDTSQYISADIKDQYNIARGRGKGNDSKGDPFLSYFFNVDKYNKNAVPDPFVSKMGSGLRDKRDAYLDSHKDSATAKIEEQLGKDYRSFLKGSKGANHRFGTLGHDPILGLIFGTTNILTNTITVRDHILQDVVGVPFPDIIRSNHVSYTIGGTIKRPLATSPQIADRALTSVALASAAARVKNDKKSVIAALIKEIIHIGTDMYTPAGIFFPGSNLVLESDQLEVLTRYISTGDVVKAGASATIAQFNNFLISALHMLTYDSKSFPSRQMFEVKTRRMIDYSNAIATGSNVILTAVKVAEGGDILALKELDVGGIIVLCRRLVSDREFIRDVKKDFVMNGFYHAIDGDGLNLQSVDI